ncbi:MAG: AZOBR_p60025 family cell surface glycopolymer formation protein [Solirubrobacteraceae bacterium]
MYTAEHTTLPRAAGLRLAARRLAVVGPALVVALVLMLLIVSRLGDYHGNPAGFILFGRNFVSHTHPPANAPVLSPMGYDGQFYWIEANDPLLLNRATVVDMVGPAGYHFQRPAYPALAWLLSLGRRTLLPWSMLAVNVLAVLGLTVALALYCRRRGWSVWWALAVGALPGLLMPTLRDLTDPLATCAMLGGLLAWSSGRRWWAAGLLALAALSREPMAAAVAAVLVDGLVRAWRARGHRTQLRRIASRAWPPVILPAAAYAAWQLYIRLQVPDVHGSVHVAASAAPAGAATAFLSRLAPMLRGFGTAASAWEMVYVALMLAGMLASIVIARRGSALGVAALLLSATLLVAPFDDQWVLSRYTAPLFGALLLAGLEQRSRPVKALCAGAAAMSMFLPWVIVGI